MVATGEKAFPLLCASSESAGSLSHRVYGFNLKCTEEGKVVVLLLMRLPLPQSDQTSMDE